MSGVGAKCGQSTAKIVGWNLGEGSKLYKKKEVVDEKKENN
jgi:hypothetical protein